ncbi:MAG: hypothetical protein GYB32_10220 [Algicola sp.]|nr:hypothetical protein [Algicola sp.]
MIKRLHLLVITCALFTGQFSFAQDHVKLMFYNLLNFPLENAVPNRLQDLELILNDYRPDLFMVCELNNSEGANTLLSSLQFINADYQSAVFELNTSDDNISDQNDLQQLIYYDSSKLILESQTIVTTIFRDFNHYQLKLNTTDQINNPVYVDVIVCHLKASSGTDNQAYRLQMAEDLTNYLNGFPPNSHVVLAGDFNVYTNSEPAFQEFLDADNNNNIKFIDPANRIGSWHNNPNYVDVMTQSTRTQTGLGGTTGGFDDRFDFIMTSENMNADPELYFVQDSYQVYGNNANPNCYNQAINSSDCDGSDYPFFLRDALHNFSDHLPVTLELATNQTLLGIPETFSETSMTIVGSNMIDQQLVLKADASLLHNSRLFIYNSLGQQVKTVDVNYTLIPVNTSSFANGIYYITDSKLQVKPLKFIIAH